MTTDDWTSGETGDRRGGIFGWWNRVPLYQRILGAMVLGAVAGLALGERAEPLVEVSSVILGLLQALAIPFIMVAVVRALSNPQIGRGSAGRLAYFLITNTLVAIAIGLLVANVLQPGRLSNLERPSGGAPDTGGFSPWEQLVSSVPTSALGPLVENQILPALIIAVAFGLALRLIRRRQTAEGQEDYLAIDAVINTLWDVFVVVLRWVIALVPIAVFAIVASIVGTEGFSPFVSLGAFVLAVLLALALQTVFYAVRLRFGSWVRPVQLVRGTSDALLAAFSTASSAATAPITYDRAVRNVKIRPESASMGSLVGSNFNNDGTALYEAMAALFVAQVIGSPLGLGQQLVLVLMAVFASVGAAGISGSGLITMVLVFTAVGLPLEYVPLLVTVDWFLDRCRTTVNVIGDLTVSSLLDGKRPSREPVGEDGQEARTPSAATTSD